jgi:hypothetical protein
MTPPKHVPTRNLLGNAPAVLTFAAGGLILTVAILALQMHFRTGLYNPRQVPIFERLFLFEDYPATFLMLAVIVLTTAIVPARRVGAAIALALGRRPLLTAGIAFPVLCLGSLFVYHAYPLAMDESAPYMQATIFVAGHLTGQFPPQLLDWLVDGSVRDYFIQASPETGRIASTYWPGFALLLTPFMALGIPWACNPAIGAASIWVIHRLTLELTESVEAAGTAVLLSLASAAFMIDSISFYSMSAHLLCNAAFALLLLRPTPLKALLAGLVGGLALNLHNPVPHALFALPWGLWLLWQRRWREVLLLAVGYLPWAVVGFAWRHLLDGMAVQHGGANGLAQAASMLRDVLRVPGLLQLLERLFALCKIWLWAAPLLVLLAGEGFLVRRRSAAVRLLMVSAVLTFVGFLFVPVSQGHGWGYRYFHSAWFVLPVLAGVAVADRGEKARGRAAWGQAGALVALLVMIPYFAWQVHAFIGRHLEQEPQANAGQPKLIIVSRNGYYALDLVQNDPFLREPVIRMASQGWEADRKMVAENFPNLVLLRREPQGEVWGLSP